jgi:uncharacterized membrane protein YecN with MAPEG domain
MFNITAIYAGLLTLIFIVLSARVIRARGNARVALGDGGSIVLTRAIRVHGNFAEYTPFAILILAFTEALSGPIWLIHLLGLSFLAARLIHAYGVGTEPEIDRLRVVGMALTLTMLGVGALAVLWLAVA